jgi:hypothetical protein
MFKVDVMIILIMIMMMIMVVVVVVVVFIFCAIFVRIIPTGCCVSARASTRVTASVRSTCHRERQS